MPLRFRILLTSLLALTTPAWAQDPAINRASRAGLQAHTEFLSGDLLEGRAAASRGYELAAAYVAAQFRQLGLAPLAGGSYMQTVPLLEAIAVLPGSSATLRRDNEEIRFEYGSDFLPSADFFASSSTLSGPLAFVGFGISAPELGYDDFAGLDIQGRIAVLLSGAPARFNAAQRMFYGATTEKYAGLIRRGAIGVIVVDTSADMPWERRIAMSWMPEMRRFDGGGQPIDAYPELKLRFQFNREAAAKLFPDPRNFDEVLASATAGEAQSFNLPGTLALTATTGLRRTESSNVVGVLRGSDPKLKNEYVVLTAHLDHLGRGPAVNGDSIYNGAHDNAVGVAMLLETARVLATLSTRPKRSIIFAAVTAGEKGALGTDFLVRQSDLSRDAVIAGIDLDTPLPIGRSLDVAALGGEHSSLGNYAVEAAKAQGMNLTLNGHPDLDPGAAVFMREGIPALSLKNGHQGRNRKEDLRGAQRDFKDTRYQQPSDQIGSVPLDYAAAADLATVNVRLLYQLADEANRPYWYRGSVFAKKPR